ncbi:MAG: phosphoenolpyruvate hydrolase family protein [Shimia sp.]
MRLTKKGEFVVGVTAGSGAVAVISAHSGADFLLAINAARLRNMGAPSIACMLPLVDARAIVESYADTEILPQVDMPVLFGMQCWRRNFDAEAETGKILRRGYAGVVNFPPSSLYPEGVQRRLEAAGIGFSAELDMLSTAQQAGAISIAYCRTISQGRQAALAKIDNILLNFGWNSGGRLSPSTENTLQEAAALTASFCRQIRRIHPHACLLLEGGPVETEEDLAVVMEHADLDGYIGGSTIERLPIERSVSDRIASFKLASKRRHRLRTSDQSLVAFGKRAGFQGQSKALLDALFGLREAKQKNRMIVCVHVPPGDSLDLPVAALTQRQRAATPDIGIDLSVPSSLSPETADKQLFGDGVSTGALGGAEADWIVIRNPEGLPESVQMRLAEKITAQLLSSSACGPRFIYVTHTSPKNSQSGYAPQFAALLRGALLSLPSLHARSEDIPDLLASAMDNLAPKDRRTFSPAALLRLRNYDWPGNTSELTAMCLELSRVADRKQISLDEVVAHISASALTKDTETRADRRQVVVDALRRNGFRKGRTAEALGISRKTLYNWMRREGLS